MKKKHLFRTITALLICSITLSSCSEIFDAIDGFFSDVGDGISNAAQQVESAVPDDVKDGVHDFGSQVVDFGSQVGSQVVDVGSQVIDAVYNWGKDTCEYIGSGEFGNDFVTFNVNAYNAAKDFVVQNGKRAGDFFTGVKDNILAFFLADGVTSLDLTKKNPKIYGWEEYAEDPETVAIGMVTRYLGQKYNVFYGVIETEEQGTLYGLAYTDYTDPYINSETGVQTFNAGFIALNDECTIPESIRDDGLIIHNVEEEKEGIQYVYSLEIDPYRTHLISGNKYIVFGIDETQTLFYETPEQIDQSLGGLYSFKDECFVFGTENDYIVLDSIYDADTSSKAVVKKMLNNVSTGFAIDIDTIFNFIVTAFEKIKNVIANLEDQTILGYNFSQLASAFNKDWYDTDIADIQNGTYELSTTSPEGSPTNTIKWLIGAATLVIFVANLVIQVIANTAGNINPAIAVLMKGASGAITAAAMDIFVETVIHSKSFKEINWVKVVISAVAGAISSFTGIYGDAVIAGITNSIFSLMDGESILRAALSFVSGFVISLALSAIISAIMKPIEAIVKKISTSIKIRHLKKAVIAELGDAVDDQSAAEIACSRYAAKSISDGTADSLLDSVDEVRKTFYKSLPSDNNPNVGIMDNAGSFITKQTYMESASKVGKLAIKDTASEEFKRIWKKSLGSLDETLDIVNGEIQFSKIGMHPVSFSDNMLTARREANFKLYRKTLAQQWNADPSSIDPKIAKYFSDSGIDVENYIFDEFDVLAAQKALKQTIHECADGTMLMVPTEFHSSVSHAGGVSLVKYLLSTSSYYQKIIKGAVA